MPPQRAIESLPSHQVLEDNFYERAAQARQERRERREGVEAMEVDPPAPSAAQEPAEAGTSAPKDDLAPDPPKRVRFAVPPTPAREDPDGALRYSCNPGASEKEKCWGVLSWAVKETNLKSTVHSVHEVRQCSQIVLIYLCNGEGKIVRGRRDKTVGSKYAAVSSWL